MNTLHRLCLGAGYWLLNDARYLTCRRPVDLKRLDRPRVALFLLLHLSCLSVFWVGVSATALWLLVMTYLTRMFFITAFYHRYFAHRSFQAGRAMMLLMAVLGCTAGQRGPLWWAGHHRRHHACADRPADAHSPVQHGLLHSHVLWFLTHEAFPVPRKWVRDWMRYPELRLLERIDWVPFVLFGLGCYLLGAWLAVAYPELGTSAAQCFTWGFLVSTVLLQHATYTINSLAHRFGSRPYPTPDHSRNNLCLALLTLGEGWHNNHHYYPRAANQGFRWWQLDPCYLGLRLLAGLGLIRDLHPVPARVLEGARDGGR